MSRLIPLLDELYYRRSSLDFIPIPSGDIDIYGSVSTSLVLTVGGTVAIGGAASYRGETSASGSVTIAGSAIRADVCTIPPVGEIDAEGSCTRAGESVVGAGGSVSIVGSVEVFIGFHYGWWSSAGFWPLVYGWWYDPEFSYEQQNGD